MLGKQIMLIGECSTPASKVLCLEARKLCEELFKKERITAKIVLSPIDAERDLYSLDIHTRKKKAIPDIVKVLRSVSTSLVQRSTYPNYEFTPKPCFSIIRKKHRERRVLPFWVSKAKPSSPLMIPASFSHHQARRDSSHRRHLRLLTFSS